MWEIAKLIPWPWKVGLILIPLLTIILGGFWIKSLKRDIYDLQAQLATSESNLQACKDNTKRANEASQKYQNDAAALNRKLGDALKLRGAGRCIPIQRESRPINGLLDG